jgi:hypothetical protein
MRNHARCNAEQTDASDHAEPSAAQEGHSLVMKGPTGSSPAGESRLRSGIRLDLAAVVVFGVSE